MRINRYDFEVWARLLRVDSRNSEGSAIPIGALSEEFTVSLLRLLARVQGSLAVNYGIRVQSGALLLDLLDEVGVTMQGAGTSSVPGRGSDEA